MLVHRHHWVRICDETILEEEVTVDGQPHSTQDGARRQSVFSFAPDPASDDSNPPVGPST